MCENYFLDFLVLFLDLGTCFYLLIVKLEWLLLDNYYMFDPFGRAENLSSLGYVEFCH